MRKKKKKFKMLISKKDPKIKILAIIIIIMT